MKNERERKKKRGMKENLEDWRKWKEKRRERDKNK